MQARAFTVEEHEYMLCNYGDGGDLYDVINNMYQ